MRHFVHERQKWRRTTFWARNSKQNLNTQVIFKKTYQHLYLGTISCSPFPWKQSTPCLHLYIQWTKDLQSFRHLIVEKWAVNMDNVQHKRLCSAQDWHKSEMSACAIWWWHVPPKLNWVIRGALQPTLSHKLDIVPEDYLRDNRIKI